jgi:hypothetical protein
MECGERVGISALLVVGDGGRHGDGRARGRSGSSRGEKGGRKTEREMQTVAMAMAMDEKRRKRSYCDLHCLEDMVM